MPAARLKVVGPLAAAGALPLTLTMLRIAAPALPLHVRQDELAEADGGVQLQIEVGIQDRTAHLQERGAR